MEIEFDPVKSAKNAAERGLPFDLVLELDWDRALVVVDQRLDYGEDRMVAFVPWNERLYVVCYVIRGQARRIISFRRANARETRAYGKTTPDD